MCWILARLESGKIALSKKEVPLSTYPIKPTRFYSDNFTFGTAVKDLFPTGTSRAC